MIAGEGEGDGETSDGVGEGDGENSNIEGEIEGKTSISAKKITDCPYSILLIYDYKARRINVYII